MKLDIFSWPSKTWVQIPLSPPNYEEQIPY